MAKIDKTNAMRILDQKKIEYSVHDYSGSGMVAGEDVAQVLGENPEEVFKTLVTVGKTGAHYVYLVPVNRELDLKKAASAVGEKYIEMVKSAELLGLTGYIHGGCSPIGMKKFFKTTVHNSAQNFEKIMFSGGKIGIQIETTLENLKKVIPFTLYDLTV